MSAYRMKRFAHFEHLVGMGSLAANPAADRSDAALAALGDVEAFGRLVGIHHPEMVRLAYVITGDASLAEDSVQVAWINAWRKLPTLRDTERLRPWLLSVAANEARQILRTRRRVSIVEIDPDLAAATTSDPAGAIQRIDLVRALSRLSPDDRALIALRYVGGFDANELGALTGRSASGTRARLSRLTSRLRKELGDV